ncbi:shikimate dehydrogenase [Lachnospiraceae bacterium MD1]|uniref:Shikimate dehydrogenase n=1 Tax=Variimorphobacter saccharofermentans TaxID=2755051 RepID=A0A839JY74_9FIRM|nr:shikimate dehydrogenase [Variimorphobacter saccharofermentans]MBB2182380.1 shikimate dehydrogenase [Variimorphobacter saccharofermentans]
MRYGLIGEKLGHSYSKIIHEKLMNISYELIPLSREEFHPFMSEKSFDAINVTIPYKQDVIPYLDELSPLANEIGAVNTIVNQSGKLTGYNTDFYGFEYMLLHNHIEIQGKKCMILGNGGTSKTVRAALKHLGASEIYVVSRKSSPNTISYEDCYEKHNDAEVIVNTTPLGMYPNVDDSPIDLSPFQKCEAAVDVIFNPLKTKFTLQAEALGIKSVNGLEMLVAQAKQAEEFFHNIHIEDARIDEIYLELYESLSNASL